MLIQIYIWLQDNNGVNNFAYHIDGEIYYTGHSLGGCDYVDTSQIPLDKYQTGDIIDPSDYDASSLGLEILLAICLMARAYFLLGSN